MLEELLACSIIFSHETVRQWAREFGQPFANRIRRRIPRIGEKWHLHEVVLCQTGIGRCLVQPLLASNRPGTERTVVVGLEARATGEGICEPATLRRFSGLRNRYT
jgi:hypothetical protein